MRKIVCARTENSKTFDVVATIDDNQTTPSGCPLAAILPHLRGESFDAFFSALVENGMIKFEHGRPTIAEMPGPCPFAQRQTQPLEEQS
jgi:hypothetical protein